jgi:TPP-dependent pyruvate/acetoin dehydrogenase alpha subunit
MKKETSKTDMSIYNKLFYEALRIRLVEEKIIELYPSDVIQSPVHLSIGQEAVAVGVCANLREKDWIFINYRGHAFYLAKGGPLPQFFAELMGRRGGQSKGKAGSMHMASPAQGVMGASAVVGSTISHAVGAALISKVKREDRIFVTNFGDGALEQGVLHESLNFASLRKTPVLFLCEDNHLAVHSPTAERQAFSVEALVKAYGIPYFEIDAGYDPLTVKNESLPAVDLVREQRTPVFLKVNTARYKEHVGPGEDFLAGYRSEADIKSWKEKDPLINDAMLRNNFVEEIKAEIEKAVQFGLSSPLPTREDLFADV